MSDELKASSTQTQAPLTSGQLLAQIVRQSLEAKGLTHQDVASITKISLEFIDAFTRADYGHLPGKVFGRGFLKNLSQISTFDLQKCLDLFDKAWEELHLANNKKQSEYLTNLNVNKNKKKKKYGRPTSPLNSRSLVLGLGTLSLFGLVSWFVWEKANEVKLPEFTQVTASAKADLVKTLPPVEEGKSSEQAQTADQIPAQDQTVEEKNATTLPTAAKELTSEVSSAAVQANTAKEDEARLKEKHDAEVRKSLEDSAKLAAQQQLAQQGAQQGVQQGVQQGAQQATQPASAPATDLNTLKMTVTKPVKIGFKEDETKPYQTKTYEAGEFGFQVSKSVDLYIYDLSAVSFVFQGKTLKNLGNPGEERKVTFHNRALQSFDVSQSEKKTAP